MKIINTCKAGEKGSTMILVLILLTLGTLILTPLLSFTSTGLKAGVVYENKFLALYAADAGIQDALWKIQNKAVGLPAHGGDLPLVYDMTDVNGRTVSVTITSEDDNTYQINSIAGCDETTIETYVDLFEFSSSFTPEHALVSPGDIMLHSGDVVQGKIEVGGVWTPNHAIYDPAKISQSPYVGWPQAGSLYAYFKSQVPTSTPFPTSLIHVATTPTLSPLYREGVLDFDNDTANSSTTLNGTVFVTGNLRFLQPGTPKAYTIDLNGQTIFAGGNISFPSSRVTVKGPGAIIANGDVTFQPSITGTGSLLVLSLNGTVNLQPSGTFQGCIGGKEGVIVQPGFEIQAQDVTGLNVPTSSGGMINVLGAIRTWKITP